MGILIMAELLHFTGFVREINYQAGLTEPLTKFPLAEFDINRAKAFGIIQTEDTELAYSKWVSPKRTQNHPLARLYNTYATQPGTGIISKILTIVPVIKDDGRDGEIDKIQYSTLAWLNLLNTYLVLGYYDRAEPQKETDRQKLTHQRLNPEFVRSQIEEIATSQQTALQWNQQLLADRFTEIVRRALDAYWEISDRTGVKIHAYVGMDDYRKALLADFEASRDESARKAPIAQAVKYNGSSTPATFCIQDDRGSIYGIAPEEILLRDGQYILQESRTSARKGLPDLAEIQDGLCKLIVYSNLDSLKIKTEAVEFSTRLKLTGRGVQGQLILPTTDEAIETFLADNDNAFYPQDHTTIQRLNLEAEQNVPLEIEIGGIQP
jgi:hypothetical protein